MLGKMEEVQHPVNPYLVITTPKNDVGAARVVEGSGLSTRGK